MNSFTTKDELQYGYKLTAFTDKSFVPGLTPSVPSNGPPARNQKHKQINESPFTPIPVPSDHKETSKPLPLVYITENKRNIEYGKHQTYDTSAMVWIAVIVMLFIAFVYGLKHR